MVEPIIKSLILSKNCDETWFTASFFTFPERICENCRFNHYYELFWMNGLQKTNLLPLPIPNKSRICE